MELWLVRHGETTWNEARRFQGGQDAELSTRGRAEAQALAAALAGERFDGLYTSPLRRARETAAACAERLGLAPTAVEALREVRLGEWEGLTVEAVVERYGERYWRWLRAPVDHPPPGGEPLAELQRRVTGAVEGIRARHPAGRALVVTHGAAIASFLCECLALDLNALWRFRVDNAAVTRVEWPGGRLLVLNDTRHLDDGHGPGGVP